MDMRRSVWVTIEQLQQLARGSVIRNWIWCWTDAIECIFAILICHELASQIEVLLVGILLLIVAVGRGHPHIDCCALERLLGLCVHDFAVHQYRLSICRCVVADIGTLGERRMIVAEERAENGALCGNIGCLSRLLVGDLVDQSIKYQFPVPLPAVRKHVRLDTEHITHQLALIALLI